MRSLDGLTRPATLQEGGMYLLRVTPPWEVGRRYVLVQFWTFQPCPAIVMVRDATGRTWRCGREDLYLARPARVEVEPGGPSERFVNHPSIAAEGQDH